MREFRRTPHPVIVTIRDNDAYIRVLLNSYYATITGWGVLLRGNLKDTADNCTGTHIGRWVLISKKVLVRREAGGWAIVRPPHARRWFPKLGFRFGTPKY